MTAKAKAKVLTKERAIATYMEYVLENETVPKSVFKFCKEIRVKEEEFYALFGSFDGLQKSIWNQFFENTINLIEQDKQYETYSGKDKMLSFFFSFFELLNLNRSYVLFVLNNGQGNMEKLAQLRGLRTQIKNYGATLVEERNAQKNLKILKQNSKIVSEAVWVQFLLLLKFWKEDNSPGLEKTDIAIEKSVSTVFEVFDNTPLERIIDLGKFLYKVNLS